MLGLRIKYMRQQVGITQKQLAQSISVAPSTVGQYEQGSREPSIDILIRIAKTLNISLDYLLTGEEYKNNTHEPILKPLTGQEGLNELIIHFLGEEWSPAIDLSIKNYNAIAVETIKNKYLRKINGG